MPLEASSDIVPVTLGAKDDHNEGSNAKAPITPHRYIFVGNDGQTRNIDSQPAVWITDYILCIVYFACALHLAAVGQRGKLLASWCAYLLLSALGYFFGAAHHHLGFVALAQARARVTDESRESGGSPACVPRAMSSVERWIVWTWSLVMSGTMLTHGSMLALGFFLALPSAAADIAAICVAPLSLGGAALLLRRSAFLLLILAALPGLIVCAAGFALEGCLAGGAWLTLGLVGVVVQQLKVGVSAEHFNHNALFHVFLFSGAIPMHIAALETTSSV